MPPIRLPASTIAAGLVAATAATALASGYVMITTRNWDGLEGAVLPVLQAGLALSVVWSTVLIGGLLRRRRWAGAAATVTLVIVAGISALALTDTVKRALLVPSTPERHLVAPAALTAWSVVGSAVSYAAGRRGELG